MIFQDNFNRADENLEANANWTRVDGTAGWGAVRSNRLACLTSDTTGAAFFCPDTYSTKQYVQAKVRDVSADSGPFLCCRLQDRSNFVGVRYNGLNGYIEAYRRNAGTLTALSGLSPVACVLDDVIRLEVDGGDYRILKNGVVIATGNSTVVGTMLSPRCGVVMRSVLQNPWVDDFEAGSLPVVAKFPASPSVGQGYAPGGGRPGWVWNGSVWVRAPAVIGSPTAGYRNVLVNGSMAIVQRNNPGVGTGQRFGIDHWWSNSVGSTTNPFYNAMPPGTQPWPLSECYFYQGVTVASVAGAGNCAQFVQRIESVRTLAGKRCALSFYAFADAARPISVEFTQYFGTGGSPSTGVDQIGVYKFNLTTGFQRYLLVFDMPSIAGKTIGTNNNDFLQLVFWLDAGASYNPNSANLGQQSGSFYFAAVQLEEGGCATPFEMRPWHAEYAMCLRYYEAGSQYVGGPCPAAGGYAEYFTQHFKVTKRAAPTITNNVTGLSNATGYNPAGSTTDFNAIQLVGAAAGNMQCNWSWTASAEL